MSLICHKWKHPLFLIWNLLSWPWHLFKRTYTDSAPCLRYAISTFWAHCLTSYINVPFQWLLQSLCFWMWSRPVRVAVEAIDTMCVCGLVLWSLAMWPLPSGMNVSGTCESELSGGWRQRHSYWLIRDTRVINWQLLKPINHWRLVMSTWLIWWYWTKTDS